MIKKSRRLAALAAEKLREMILTDELKAGEPLGEVSLAEELAMSRTPVREAITLLEGEGLVRVVPGKGAFVTEISLEDFKEINDLWGCLEPLAALSAIGNIDGDELDREIKRWSAFRDELDAGGQLDSAEVARADGHLHGLIARCGNNRRLRQFLNILAAQRGRHVFFMWRLGHFNRESILQHLRILDCLKRRDPDGLRKAVLEHMEQNNWYVAERLKGF